MRNSKEDKARNHQRIVEIAAQRIRESGTDGPGVAEIMQAAGMTHGGFYKHFGSREELIAEAAVQAFADGTRGSAEAVAGAEDPLAAFVDWYVSSTHVAEPGRGCAVVALGADAGRADARLRRAYTEQVERYLAHLQELLGDGATRADAAVTLSTLVGSVLVARAVDDPALSETMLSAVRGSLQAR